MFRKLLLISTTTLLLIGCVTNPVTGYNELVLIEERQEIAMGQEVFPVMQEKEGGLYTKHPEIAAYVQRVGNKLAAVSDRPGLPYEFVVLDNATPNAWTLPGGKIAVNSGLLTELENEAELAAVLAHEIVHAAGRHGAQMLEKNALIDMAATMGTNAAGEEGMANELIQIGSTLIKLKYSRNKEFEADEFGMKYMAKAGYDVAAAVSLQEKFLKLADNKDPNWLEGLFSTHPPSKERVKANRKTAEQYPKGGLLSKDTYQEEVVKRVQS